MLAFTLVSYGSAVNASAAGSLSEPLRTQPDATVADTPTAVIEGADSRIAFYEASWSGGTTYVRELSVRDGGSWAQVTSREGRLDEQWVVFTGETGSAVDLYDTMTPHWVAFDSLEVIDDSTAELTASVSDVYDLTVRWSLDAELPTASYTLVPHRDQHYVVGLQSSEVRDFEQVDEVLCGPRQHSRAVIEDVKSLGDFDLGFPGCMIQQDIEGKPYTFGVVAPADQIPFAHPYGRDRQDAIFEAQRAQPTDQAFGMSLLNEVRDVQVVGYAPQFGQASLMTAGEPSSFTFGLYARPNTLSDAYEELARTEYDYNDYRENVFDTSLTETMFNLIDLVKVEPEGDDSVDFIPSPSGWWSRAKGFVDVENDQAVRTPTTGVLLSAYQLTGDDELYDTRALPMIEHHLSRNGHGWTPKKGNPVYGNVDSYQMGDIVFDASALGPLYSAMRGRNAGIHALALDAVKDPPKLNVSPNGRTPISTALAAYRMTGNDTYLAEAKAIARRYIEAEIATPYTENLPENHFQYSFVKGWTELLELYEVTGEQEFLDAAHTEARRFVTQHYVRPVPDGTIALPEQPWVDSQVDRWEEGAMWDYPTSEPEVEEVNKWIVSDNGMSFEAPLQLRGSGGTSMMPTWAPFLLRLAEHTDDDLLADIAHNLVVGRYTNYPGYYNRQFSAQQMKPDYPYQGPPGMSSIYYHHAPALLGLTMDYLVTEHIARSDSAIDFPGEFESNFIFFKYNTYGHAPGQFYGDDDVWLWMPKGIATTDNSQINWITAEGNGKLYLSLTNESASAEQVTVQLDPDIVPFDPNRTYPVQVIKDNGPPEPAVMRDGEITADVSAKGITAVVIDGIDVDLPLHTQSDVNDTAEDSYHSEDGPLGVSRGLLLVKPDSSRYDAYIHTATEEPATLNYSLDDGDTWEVIPDTVYPNEWTVPVDDLTTPITYFIESDGQQTETANLSLPSSITGTCAADADACGELTPARAEIVPGDSVTVEATVRNAGTTVIEDVRVSVDAPEGWTVTPADATPAGVSPPARRAIQPGESQTVAFEVAVPADQAVADSLAITGRATFVRDDKPEEVSLEPSQVDVLSPVMLTAFEADPATLLDPGDSTTIKASVLNRSPVSRDATVALDVPDGWSVEPDPEQSAQIEGGQEDMLAFTVTSPPDARREQPVTIAATLSPYADEAELKVEIATADVIVDTTAPWPQHLEDGAWFSSGLRGFGGTGTRYTSSNNGGISAKWTPELRLPGAYNVYVWFPSHPNTTTEASYMVEHSGGSTSYVVNQQADGGQWRLLGEHEFEAGTEGSVTLLVEGDGVHRADAVRFEPVSATG